MSYGVISELCDDQFKCYYLLDLLFVCTVGESSDLVNIIITEPVYPDTASSGHLEMKVLYYHTCTRLTYCSVILFIS